MEGMKFVKRPKLKNPHLIVAWPGMGEVAFKAAAYLVEQLGAQDLAVMLPEDYFYLAASVIQDGLLHMPELPQGKFYFWRNPAAKSAVKETEAHDLIIFLSNAQPDLAKAQVYAEKILQLAKSFNVARIISLASMPQPIDHTQEPRVWLACTTEALKKELQAFAPDILSQGQISGMNGLFLGIAKQQGYEGFCLLGEIPLYTIQIENPRAALAVVNVVVKILKLQIDLGPLTQQARHMETEINKLLDYFKLGSGGQVSPIGEEEVERIKKTLGQLTKLPGSIKEKIEKIFDQAKVDLSKAQELKSELDKWNVYKEYEDRFLDLFKKKKEKDN